jgi:hypothetical protein
MPASAFARASDIQTAVVTNDGTTATLVRGTAIAATRLGAPEVDVEFPRDVSNCTWNATAGDPGKRPASPLIATGPGRYERPRPRFGRPLQHLGARSRWRLPPHGGLLRVTVSLLQSRSKRRG